MRNLVGGVMTPPYEWHPYKQQFEHVTLGCAYMEGRNNLRVSFLL